MVRLAKVMSKKESEGQVLLILLSSIEQKETGVLFVYNPIYTEQKRNFPCV
jgi:hypothetical protein